MGRHRKVWIDERMLGFLLLNLFKELKRLRSL